ncbi:hypothetical protein V8C86DRAFT_1218830 [Haematococcus lacustris]
MPDQVSTHSSPHPVLPPSSPCLPGTLTKVSRLATMNGGSKALTATGKQAVGRRSTLSVAPAFMLPLPMKCPANRPDGHHAVAQPSSSAPPPQPSSASTVSAVTVSAATLIQTQPGEQPSAPTTPHSLTLPPATPSMPPAVVPALLRPPPPAGSPGPGSQGCTQPTHPPAPGVLVAGPPLAAAGAAHLAAASSTLGPGPAPVGSAEHRLQSAGN